MTARNGWRFAVYQIAALDAVAFTDGYISHTAPSLAVNRNGGGLPGWRVTHLDSGRAIGPPLRTLADAKRRAEKLATLGNWSRSGEEILADAEMRARLYEECGLTPGVPA